MEELVGRLSFASRFPQYLWASVEDGGGVRRADLLDNCNVDWRSCAGLVDFCVWHFEINQ